MSLYDYILINKKDEQNDTDESIFTRYKIWPSLTVD
jgi:hypothetical protein